MGQRSARARAARGQADPALRRLLGVPLVSRDGARIVRGSRGRGGDERPLRERQGRSRGAPGHRPDLPGGACATHAPLGRLAPDDVPHAGRRAVLRRHLFPEGRALWAAGVHRPPAARRGGVPRPARRDRGAERPVDRGAREPGARACRRGRRPSGAAGVGTASGARRARAELRSGARRLRRGAQVPASDGPRVLPARARADR